MALLNQQFPRCELCSLKDIDIVYTQIVIAENNGSFKYQ